MSCSSFVQLTDKYIRNSCQRLPLVRLLPALLGPCFHPADPLIAGRVIKTLLPTIGRTFSQKSSVESASLQVKGNKKAKKRVQGYEGDEVFKAGSEVIFSSPEEGELILHSVDGKSLRLLLTGDAKFKQSCCSAPVFASHTGPSGVPTIAYFSRFVIPAHALTHHGGRQPFI